MIDLAARLAAMEQKRLQYDAETIVPKTSAERMANMRLRDKATGINRDTSRDRSDRNREQEYNATRTLFQSGQFIAVDGEGVSEGKLSTYPASATENAFQAMPHYMILLAASTGAEISCKSARLSLAACITFLLDLSTDNPHSILVCYGGSYDVNQMLLYNLSRRALEAISQGGNAIFVINDKAYKIQYRARKCLQIWRFPTSKIRQEEVSPGKYRDEKAEASCTLWDVIGFFQGSFESTMSKWLGETHPDFLFIQSMKSQRAFFNRLMLDEMKRYNQAECSALVAIMNKLRSAVQSLNLTLNRWDGAGAVAAAMNKLHNVKLYKGETPPAVFEAARRAFSGGHIEVCQIGTFNRPIYHYDENSAYPHHLLSLPSLVSGQWEHGDTFDPPPGFTLVRVKYAFKSNLPFYPLFFRTQDGCILYPQHGEGWYWHSEFSVAREFAMRFGADQFDVVEWFHFIPGSNDKPFAFIEQYYEQRRLMDAKIKAGNLQEQDQWMLGAEKVIKLGLNSLYGKTAQQVGGKNGKAPPYFQLEWAGWVTAGCRSDIMLAAMQSPESIISFATDGIFSTKPLSLDCPKDKILGKWEFKRHSGLVVAMPGVYWIFDGSNGMQPGAPSQAYSRGFDKEATKTPDLVLAAWQAGKTSVPIPMKRLITMGTASNCLSEKGTSWRARGRFMEGVRQLDISGDSIKRQPPSRVGRKPLSLHLQSARTLPRPNVQYLDAPFDEALSLSAPYAIKWLDGGDAREEYDAGVLQEHEMLDADDTEW